jgi:signal transduction histidine kinase
MRSYRNRLLLAFLAVTLASLALFAGLTATQVIRYSRQARGEELRMRLKLVSNWLDPTTLAGQDALHRLSGDLGAAILVIFPDDRPRFYAADGYALTAADIAEARGVAAEAALRLPASTIQRGGLAIAVQPFPLADGTTALLIAAEPAARLEVGWRRLLDALAYAGLLGLAGSLLLALLLARSISRPDGRLIAAADRVAQGVYDDPPLPAGADELGRLTAAFNAMRERVRQGQQIQRDFLAGVSHDLKTPLTVIQGYATALADGVAAESGASAADQEPALRRAAAGIQRETERMARLIAALLELARLEAGLTPFHPQPLDLAALARGALADLAAQAAEAGVRLEDSLPASLPLILADAGQLERVLANLLENAIRYTPAGASVIVGGEQRRTDVAIWVEDAGPGIPAEALPRIFDRFYQADPARAAGRRGSGLGLAIAREIVLRHAGALSAENRPPRGARFTVALPLAGEG